jgi:hypothetical protein
VESEGVGGHRLAHPDEIFRVNSGRARAAAHRNWRGHLPEAVRRERVPARPQTLRVKERCARPSPGPGPSRPGPAGTKLRLVAAICSGLGDLVAGGPDLLEGHIGTDACSGQDQHAAETLQQRSTGVVLQLQPGILELLDLGCIRLVFGGFTSLRSLSVRDGYIHLGTQNT